MKPEGSVMKVAGTQHGGHMKYTCTPGKLSVIFAKLVLTVYPPPDITLNIEQYIRDVKNHRGKHPRCMLIDENGTPIKIEKGYRVKSFEIEFEEIDDER